MWSWIKRRPASRGSAWTIRHQGEGLSLQFGGADPVVLAWVAGDAHAQARLMAVLRQAARTSPPGVGQLRLEAVGTEQAALAAALQEALGPRAAQALAGPSVAGSRLRQQLAYLPWRGLSVLVIVLALGLLLPLERKPASQPAAPAAAPAPQSVLAGQSPASPLGWIEALAQQASASGAGDWRLIELRADREGAFQLRIQMLTAAGAPVLGGTDPSVARLEAVRQMLDRQPGRVSVAMQPARGEGVLVFKQGAAGVAATAGPAAGRAVLSAERIQQLASSAGLRASGAGAQAVPGAAGPWIGPVQSVASLLAQLGPALAWSEIRLLSMERDPQQPGLAQLRLEGLSAQGARP